MIEIFQVYWREFLQGTLVTLELTLVALGIGFILGLPLAMARVYGGRVPAAIATAYIEIIRGTPVLVQLFIIYYGLPTLKVTLPQITAAFLAMGLNSAAYQAEYFRGAIQAIGSGQMMAGRAIGMSKLQTVMHIILPQALRIVIPPWSNEPVSLLKVSAVAFLIALPDLMGQAKAAAIDTYDVIGAYSAAAVVYFVLVAILSVVLSGFDKRLRIPGLELEAQR